MRRKGRSHELLLFGLECSLSLFKRYQDDPAGWLEFLALTRERSWKPGESARAKTNMMVHGWRPDYFKK
jgi:hypothetical protein